MMYILGVQGQLCNQLFRLAHHIGNSLHYEYEMSCLVFPYRNYFPNLNANQLVKVRKNELAWQQKIIKVISKSVSVPIIQSIMKKLGVSVIANPYNFIKNDTAFVETNKRKVVVVTTWMFRDYENFKFKAESIRHLFEPALEYCIKAKIIINIAKKEDRPLIGIHVRRGDYREWEGGKFYFEDYVYRDLMEHLLTLPELKGATFLLCSNELINESSYVGLSIFSSLNNHFMTDLTLLSYCDYLLGPPSTFSAWASFMGNVPLYHMTEVASKPSLIDFSVSNG